jgi:hypothetical protein
MRRAADGEHAATGLREPRVLRDFRKICAKTAAEQGFVKEFSIRLTACLPRFVKSR